METYDCGKMEGLLKVDHEVVNIVRKTSFTASARKPKASSRGQAQLTPKRRKSKSKSKDIKTHRLMKTKKQI